MTKKYNNFISIILVIFLSIFVFLGAKHNEDNQILYNGKIEHLTFNTLIAFPEKILNENNSKHKYYDETKITPFEFKNILSELYKNNYVLIDIEDTFFIDNNTINFKDIYIPKNKKPIILSFNNVTYKNNYQNSGEISKIIIDRNNQFATYSTKRSIQDKIKYDNEFIPILETFITQHPTFSINSARGIIFLSGENGILGYNTCKNNPSSKQETKKVFEIVNKLKSNGWKFGCNNYQNIPEDTLSDIEFIKNISLWNQEIKEIVNSTTLYAYPNGNEITQTNKKKILLNNNFQFFFTNSMNTEFIKDNNSLIMSRKPVNGLTLRNNKDNFKELFDCELVYDHENRLTPFNELQI